MTDAPEWDLFQSLHAVLASGSLSGAARLRGLSQPTLGRHIEALEARLGAPLFVRSPRGLQPTDLALDLRPLLQEMADNAATAVRDAAGRAGGLAGVVRITASEVVGGEVLPAILADVRRRHTGLDFELVLSNRTEDLMRREADIAVRMTPPTQAALVARKVGEIPLGVFAAPAFLEGRDAPTDLAALAGEPLIGPDSPERLRQVTGLSVSFETARFALRCDNDLAQLAALRAGFGVGVAQLQLGRRYGLTRLFPELTVGMLGVWIVMHEALKASPRMRLVFDALVAGMSAYVNEPLTA